ncbi:MAG: aminoacyl-tRNA hydrolase [Bacillota bacterium]|nr:MAG: aminoacyl-tRNA hydrolase [Bacillota bacterium]
MDAASLLLVGLGNPGPQYASTRHNVGFWVIDEISRAAGIKVGQRGFSALWGQGRIDGVPVVLCKPQTYMNLSGRAVAPLAARLGLPPEAVWLVHDDLGPPPGRPRLRLGRGGRGHRGVRSVIAALGSRQVGRIRVGIGRPPEGVDAADYVLQTPRGAERDILNAAVRRAAEAALTLVRLGPEAAMNRFNTAVSDPI